MRFTIERARTMARRTLMAVGASDAVATSLANATIAAELSGRRSVGFAHLLDYLDGIAAGRIAGSAKPDISFPTPAAIRIDARGGIAQLGFDLAFDELQARAGIYGIALLSQANSYTVGELGYYTRRLAGVGLIALAASNGPALVAVGGSHQAVYGTNPLSFAAPVETAHPCSSTRHRARRHLSMSGERRRWARRFPVVGPLIRKADPPPIRARPSRGRFSHLAASAEPISR
jgi:(2R)-3-sulfolactate dehydrogenase (NADP+)